jgi:hypothetical protein
MRLLITIGTLMFGLSVAQATAQTRVLPLEGMSPVVERIAQSSHLIRYGRETNNPLALVLAAQMLRETGLQRNVGGKGNAIGVEDAAFPSVEILLAEASSRSENLPPLKQLIENILAARDKGRETGPLYEIAILKSEATEMFPDIRFAKGKRAEIYVEGTGKLALSVRDMTGRNLCEDDRKNEVAYCWWQQVESGSVRVEVTNRTATPVTVRLVTN